MNASTSSTALTDLATPTAPTASSDSATSAAPTVSAVTATTDESSRESARLRHVLLEDFRPAVAVEPEERDTYYRRYASLFLDEERVRSGASGRVCYGQNAWGDSLAVKIIQARNQGNVDTDGGLGDNNGLSANDISSEASSSNESDRGVNTHNASSDSDAIDTALFKREYEAQRMLSGVRGFPTLYGWGYLEGHPVIVMEWLSGETLARVREQLAVDDRGALPPRTAAALGRDLFELIARMELFDEGLVHRDLSLSNVIVVTDQKSVQQQAKESSFDLRVIDFGSAVLPYRAPSLTEMGGAMRGATPDYAAPEMLTEDIPGLAALRKSSAVDVYAAASIVYLLLCGYPPYDLKPAGVGGVDGPSYYLKKTHELPRSLEDAHKAAPNLRAVLKREAIIDDALSQALKNTDASDDEIQAALRKVDGQISDVVLACLEPSQKLRPSAASVRDAFARIADNYQRNVARALQGTEITAPWNLSQGKKRHVARRRQAFGVAARVLVGVVFAMVVIGMGITMQGAPYIIDLGFITWGAYLSGWVVGVALALPSALGYLLRWRGMRTKAGFIRGTLGILVGSVLLSLLLLTLRFAIPMLWNLMLWSIWLCAAAAWMPLVLDFAKSRGASAVRLAQDK